MIFVVQGGQVKKKMKIIAFCLGIPFLFAIAFFSFAPEPRTNAVIESYRRVTRNPGQGCLDYTRKKLKDPSSIRLIDWHEEKKNDVVGAVILNYKATNDYGGYVKGTQKCTLINGVVNELSTEINDLTADLKRKNDELDKAGIHVYKGNVKEVIKNNGYTYLSVLNENGKQVWLAATPESKINIGDNISYREYEKEAKLDFRSKSLNKTFKKIYFIGNAIRHDN